MQTEVDPDGRLDGATLRLRSDVTVDASGDALRLACPVGTFALRAVAPRVVAALRSFDGTARAVGDAADGLTEPEARQLWTILRRLSDLFVHRIESHGRPLVEVEVTRRHARYEPASLAVGTPVRLSRFALLRTHAGALVLESPLSGHRFTLLDAAAVAAAGALGGRYTAGEPVAGVNRPVMEKLLGHLVGAGLAEAGRSDGDVHVFPSDEDDTLRQWEFHDLLAHSRSRVGGFDQPLGAVFAHRDRIGPQPAVRPLPEGGAIPLHRPDLDAVAADDPALGTVLEGRRSLRAYGEQPMTAEQLGEFLYRTARVRGRRGPTASTPYETTSRPYPSGGGVHDLELYLSVRRCAGVEPGVYGYDPVGHRLVLVNGDPRDLAAMVGSAATGIGFLAEPDVVLTVTSRFQRLSWKYRAIAYSLALKHVGVLYQTMYLVATAMRLAPCALGSGDSELAARVLGLDPLEEPAVGEFLLGSRPAPVPGA
ncbi:SagB-type dehydrogenase family enzyme [Streptacidiphilus sp. MAP12-33]|uniref:SagB/ThcOx family dehydrogenase n=1 Tax=Streptacidiphilus sp. MAP12-33 TaxID=3156266 RepID=UPI003512EF50